MELYNLRHAVLKSKTKTLSKFETTMSANNSIPFQIRNEVTELSGELTISSEGLTSSVLEAIYENDAVIAANIRKWPSELAAKCKEGSFAIHLFVLDKDSVQVKKLSIDEMKTTTVQDLVEAVPPDDPDERIQLLLKCEREENASEPDNVASKTGESSSEEREPFENKIPVESALEVEQKPLSQVNRSGARFCITNAYTSTSKNMRIAPAMVNSSIFEAIYDNDVLKEAGIRGWPREIAEELKSETMAVQIFVETQDDNAYFIDDMKTTSVLQLLTSTSYENGDVIELVLRAVVIPNALSVEEKEAKIKEDEAQAEERKKEKAEKIMVVMEAEAVAKQKTNEEAGAKAAEEAEASDVLLDEAQAEKAEKIMAVMEAEAVAKQKTNEEAGAKAAEEAEVSDVLLDEAQAEKEKAEKIMAVMEAEAVALQKTNEEAGAKAAEEARVYNGRIEQAKTKKEAALQAEKAARMDAGNEAEATEVEEESTPMDELPDDVEMKDAEMEAQNVESEEETTSMDDMLEAEEMKELRALEDAEVGAIEDATHARESDVLLHTEELAELMKEEVLRKETLLVEYDKEKVKEEASREAEFLARCKEEDALRQKQEDELSRIIAAKEEERKEEEEERERNEEQEQKSRMKALEEKAKKIEKESLRSKEAESPKDRTLHWEQRTRGVRHGVAVRLLKAESMFVPDSRKRSPDVIPLTSEFAFFMRKLRHLVALAKDYLMARKQMEESRYKLLEDYTTLTKNSPLHNHVGKMLNPGQTAGFTAHEVMKIAEETGTISLASMYQIASINSEKDVIEYEEQIIEYVIEWDMAVSTQAEKALEVHRKLEQDALHYEDKVAKLRSKAIGAEGKKKVLSSNDAAKLNRNEMKLNDAWQIYEQECGRICNLFEEITHKGWKDLYPLVKNTIQWEIDRMDKETSTSAIYLPRILQDINETMDGQSSEVDTGNLQSLLDSEKAENRSLMYQVNKIEAVLRGSWETKAELKQILDEKSIQVNL